MKQMIIEKTKKLLRFGVYMLLPMLGGAWVGVSCTDTWDDHYDSLGGGENGVHEGTIWSAIKSNPNMSNFAKLIEGCDYVDRLNGSQVFTVFVLLCCRGRRADCRVQGSGRKGAAREQYGCQGVHSEPHGAL